MAKRYTHTKTRDGKPVVVRNPPGSLDTPMTVKSFGLGDTIRTLRGKH